MDTVVKFVFGPFDQFERRVNEIVNEYTNKGYELTMISPVTGTAYEHTDPYGKRWTTVTYSQSFVFQKK